MEREGIAGNEPDNFYRYRNHTSKAGLVSETAVSSTFLVRLVTSIVLLYPLVTNYR